MNDVQDELIAIQTDASIAESAGSNAQILKLIKFNAIKYSKNIGEFFWLEDNKNPLAFAINTPDNFFPAINSVSNVSFCAKTLIVQNNNILNIHFFIG